jgi:hypothetical protein
MLQKRSFLNQKNRVIQPLCLTLLDGSDEPFLNTDLLRKRVLSWQHGPIREWELVEYVQDMIASGRKKAMIVMGHVISEQSDMKYCAEWLKTFIPEVPVDFIAAAEPF